MLSLNTHRKRQAMTSSQGVASYYFTSHEPEIDNMDKLSSVSRLSASHSGYYQDRCKTDPRGPQKGFQGHGLRLERRVEHRKQQCRWSNGDLWSVGGRAMLVILLAVTCQCLASAESGRDESPSVIRLGDCRALISGTVVDLNRLHPVNVSVRYTVSVEDGWKVAWNPCTSFNLPTDPHSGSADQCFHVAMCKYKPYSELSDSGDYYTLGIRSTAELTTPPSQPALTNHTSSPTPVNQQPGGAPGMTSLLDGPAHDVITGSRVENWTTAESGRTSVVKEGHVTTTTDDVLRRHKLTFDTTTTTAHVDDNDDDDDDDDDVADDDDDDSASSDDSDNDADYNSNIRVAALVYHGIRSMKRHISTVYIVCHRRHTAPSFVYLGSTTSEHYFELRCCCCCADGRCAESDSSSDDDDDDDDDVGNDNKIHALRGPGEGMFDRDEAGSDRASVTERSAQFIWLLVVVNAAIIAMSLLIAVLCCRRPRGGYVTLQGPYTYVPGAQNNEVNMNGRRSSGGSVSQGLWPRQSSTKPPPPIAVVSGVDAGYRDYSKASSTRGVPLLDYSVIPTDHVHIAQRLGGGLFSDTYFAHWKGRRVAAKRIMDGTHQTDCDWIVNSIAVLSKRRHDTLANVIGVCINSRPPYVIVEFVDGESLRDLIKRSTGDLQACSWVQRVKVCFQTADGLAFLHSAKPTILHRDLRSANILMDNTGHVKVVNFGLTKIIQKLRSDCDHVNCYCHKERSAVPETSRWTAPEILTHPDADEMTSCDVFSTACDVYSFAVLLWELATFSVPFEDVAEESQVIKMVLEGARPSVEISYDVPAHYVELMTACWDEEPQTRPHFKQISHHLKNILHSVVKSASSSSNHRERTRSLSLTTGYLRSMLNVAARNRSDSVSSTRTAASAFTPINETETPI